MKTVIALGVMQFGLLLFLVGKVVVLDRDRQNVSAVQALQPASGRATRLSTDDMAMADTSASEMRLREIIREELAAQLGALPGLASDSNSKQTVAYRTDPAELARKQKQFESVAEKISFYESVGTISEYQMHELQSAIVKLSPEDRKEAFTLLMRTMSSGALEGQL